MNIEELEAAIYEEWGDLHHNASMSRVLYGGSGIDFQNEYEEHLFFSVVSMETSDFWIDDLTEQVRMEFGYDLKFYSYGRQGATIAPDTWKRPSACNSFAGFDSSILPCEGDGFEQYNEFYRVLKTLRFINEYWRVVVNDLPNWWRETKEANEYQADIDAHEGMTLRRRDVWEEIG